MFKRILKIISLVFILGVASLMAAFILWPRFFLDISIYLDDTSIFACWPIVPYCQEISGTDTYKFGLNWSPDGRHLSFYDEIKESNDRRTFLKIVNPLTLRTKTIFIGPWGTGYSKWLDNKTIRAYVRGGTGVKGYCDININRSRPFVLYDDDRDNELNPCGFIQIWLDDLNQPGFDFGKN
ncbi:MAG: hypothetical protein WC523_01890 [Patescibacteria group bacterium]|jgi:hypothetical protein